MPFTFRHQPFKTLYLTGTIPILIFRHLPFWTVRNIFPPLRPRPKWSIGRSLIVAAYRAYIDAIYDTGLRHVISITKAAEDAEETGFVWLDATPSLIVGEIHEKAVENGVEAGSR